MDRIYIDNRNKFIRLFGNDKFVKLYNIVNESNAIIKLTGATVNSGLPPTAADFLGFANTIPYVIIRFDSGVSTMASLILLKIWNKTTNSYLELISEQRISIIAEQISARWI